MELRSRGKRSCCLPRCRNSVTRAAPSLPRRRFRRSTSWEGRPRSRRGESARDPVPWRPGCRGGCPMSHLEERSGILPGHHRAPRRFQQSGRGDRLSLHIGAGRHEGSVGPGMLPEVSPGVRHGFQGTGTDMVDSRKNVPFAEISIVLSKYGAGTAGLAHSSGRLQSE